jgi:thioredoxin 1
VAGMASSEHGARPSRLCRAACDSFLLAVLAAAVAGALALGCGVGDGDGARTSDEEASTSVVPVADSSAARTASDSKGGSVLTDARGIPVLLDLGADKCVPCKMMAPILEEMSVTFVGQLDVRFIDVWKDGSAAREHGVGVIPTQIFFDEQGNELFRHQGFFSREDMLRKWAELGYVFEG